MKEKMFHYQRSRGRQVSDVGRAVTVLGGKARGQLGQSWPKDSIALRSQRYHSPAHIWPGCPTTAYMTVRLSQVCQAQATAPPYGSSLGAPGPDSEGPGEARPHTLRARKAGNRENGPHPGHREGDSRGCSCRGISTPCSEGICKQERHCLRPLSEMCR